MEHLVVTKKELKKRCLAVWPLVTCLGIIAYALKYTSLFSEGDASNVYWVDVAQAGHNASGLVDLNLTDSGLFKLTQIALFIEDVKSTLPQENLLKDLNLVIHEDESIPLFASVLPSWEPMVGIDMSLLTKELYTLDELKVGIAHELGHVLKNHLSFKNMFLRWMHETYYVVIPLLTAPYMQQMEFEADKTILEFKLDPCFLLSFLEKFEAESFKLETESSTSYEMELFKFLDELRPIPLKYRSSHPSNQERATALILDNGCSFFQSKPAESSASEINEVRLD